MPIFNRRELRQRLGLDHIRDTIVSRTTASWGALHLIDRTQADVTFSGDERYHRSWGRLFPTGSSNGVDFRVASFNAGSGAFVSVQADATVVGSGADFEIHDMLSPDEKDRALDAAISRVRRRSTVGIPTITGLTHYTLEGAASPNLINPELILDVYYLSDPSNSLNRDRQGLAWWGVVQTATGWELRIDPALGASQQLILDTILTLTLGAGEVATVNIPDAEMVLYGAETRAWDLLMKRAPGQESQQYLRKRRDAAVEFSRRAALHQPRISRPVPHLDEPF